MKRQSSWRVALLLAVGLVSAAFAQEAPKAAPEAPEAAKPALMDRAATLAAAAEVTKAKYPDADDVLVDDFIFVRYEADGTSVTFDETWTKVLTEKGRRDNERMSLDFDEAFSKVAFDLLEVIKPDGTAVPVDVAAQSRVTTESGQMSENIYDPNVQAARGRHSRPGRRRHRPLPRDPHHVQGARAEHLERLDRAREPPRRSAISSTRSPARRNSRCAASRSRTRCPAR